MKIVARMAMLRVSGAAKPGPCSVWRPKVLQFLAASLSY